MFMHVMEQTINIENEPQFITPSLKTIWGVNHNGPFFYSYIVCTLLTEESITS